MQKYKLIEDQVIEFEYHKLYRIEAVRDFGRIKKGQRGGYIENEKNLSHEGDCWIHDDAKDMIRLKYLEMLELWIMSK